MTDFGSPVVWRKSSYSAQAEGQCVEVAMLPPAWRKSSHSAQPQGQCVEVAPFPGRVGVRDSKNPTRGHLTVTAPAWKAFLAGLERDG